MINLQTRELVLKWKKEGKKQQQIADLVGCNQSAISRLIAKHKKTGSIKNMPRSGRPTPLTKNTLAKLKAELRNFSQMELLYYTIQRTAMSGKAQSKSLKCEGQISRRR